MSYKKLKTSFVIFFCTYDPFGLNRYVYTFESRCLEDLQLPLGDDTRVIIFNTKGSEGELSNEMRDLLHYMEGNAPASEYTRSLSNDVEDVKESKEWRREYMVMMERDRNNIDLGRYAEKVARVRKNRQRWSSSEIADFMEIKPQTVTLILTKIDEHPDWDDEEVAEDILEEEE